MRMAVFAADHLGLILQDLVERREARWLVDSAEAHVSHHRLGKGKKLTIALDPDGCLMGVLFLDNLQIWLGGIDERLNKTSLLPSQFQQIVPLCGLLEGDAVGRQGFSNHRLGYA